MTELFQWAGALPAFLFGIVIIIGPGALIATALGSRGFSWLALSLAGSFLSIAAASIVSPIVGITWSVIPVFIVALTLALIAFFLRKLWLGPSVKSSTESWSGFGKELLFVLIPVTLISLVFILGVGSPDSPSQTYDAIHHLTAVRHISESGSASPFSMTFVRSEQAFHYYPSLWHAFASLLLPFVGSVFAAANVASMIIAAIVWPIALLFFIKTSVGLENRQHWFWAALVVASFPAFPLLMLQFGVLYPNLLGFALLPIGFGLLVMLLGWAKENTLETPGRVLTLLGTIVALGSAHPNAVLSLIALALPAVLLNLYSQWKAAGKQNLKQQQRKIVGVGILLVAATGALWLFSYVGVHWQPYQSFPQAVGELLFFDGSLSYPAVLVGVLVVIGVLTIATQKMRQQYWLLASFGVAAWLFLLATGLDLGIHIRAAFLGVWYSDPFRVTALLPVIAAPLAVLGLKRVLEVKLFSQASKPRLVLTSFAVIGVLATQAYPMWYGMRGSLAEVYDTERGYLLNNNELAVFDYIEENIPQDQVIIGSPWNGSSLVYAYAGNESLFYVPRGTYPADQMKIARWLTQDAGSVCLEVESVGVDYLLDFGDDLIVKGEHLENAFVPISRYQGLIHAQNSEFLELVYQVGEAKLYKVAGC